MTQLTTNEQGDLEQLIDAHGLESVLSAIGDICNEKASHVETNWQDKPLARQWDRRAKAIARAEAKILTMPVV